MLWPAASNLRPESLGKMGQRTAAVQCGLEAVTDITWNKGRAGFIGRNAQTAGRDVTVQAAT